MTKSRKSPIKLPKRSALVGLAVVLLLVVGWCVYRLPTAARSAAATGDKLVANDPGKALIWYDVSDWLHPHDPVVVTKIARLQLADGQPNAAAKTLAPVLKHPTSTSLLLDSQIKLELNQTTAAVTSAKQAGATEQLGLSLAVAGNQSDLNKLIAALPNGALRTELTGVGESQAYLGEILYERGLVESANRVLTKLPQPSAQVDLLRAVVVLRLGKGSRASLEQGRDLLTDAVAQAPAQVSLRQALESVDLKLGDKADAQAQANKIATLKSGKI